MHVASQERMVAVCHALYNTVHSGVDNVYYYDVLRLTSIVLKLLLVQWSDIFTIWFITHTLKALLILQYTMQPKFLIQNRFIMKMNI